MVSFILLQFIGSKREMTYGDHHRDGVDLILHWPRSLFKDEADTVPEGKCVAGINEKPQHAESKTGEKAALDIIVTSEDQVLVVPSRARTKTINH
jgi:hypothetical protein